MIRPSEFDDAVISRVVCDCHDNSHDVDIWIEAERDDETREITITFYRVLGTPFWEAIFNRLLEAWRILWCTLQQTV